MAGKLYTDSVVIGDPYAQFYYVYARLSDRLRTLILPYVRTVAPGASDPSALI